MRRVKVKQEESYSFLLLRILFGAHIESIHRYVFDTLYLQEYVITKRDTPMLVYYKYLHRAFPTFRAYLKLHKERLNKKQNMGLGERVARNRLSKINTSRYSSFTP